MRADTITLAIFEKYEPAEKTEIADKLAQAQADMETVELEKKVSDSAFNDRIKKLSADVSTLAKQYNKGGETAQIGCDIRYDHPGPGQKSYFRMDKTELVETHDMSWDEKQETLQFPLAASPDSPTIAQPTDEQVNDTLAGLDPGSDEEVTRLCPFPGCKLFAEHDGDHSLAPPEDAAGDEESAA
jgi:hypothetical protein